ncbi:FAD-dependent oxidoreductase [Desulfuromonas sp. AOP6]|uniref:NAD(P)/FAD-dependent oxidoreductase n=1 Tax=Desulfuromonas sp. AOP6 TaxID=1566351 RepID=UPI00127D5021|nr:FAD-dependent oxidoreductase [Desulfuromonas sp. AOP6]BCA79297.1 amine oxidase [Desulfuromonas sp. AOP6]
MTQDHARPGQRIAVIGGGVAGIVAAHLLQERHEVTLFEKNDYLGGHTHTIEIKEGPDAGAAVDTGFIVLNDRTYPLFQTFLKRLGVATRDSEMSFGFQCHQSGLVYAGTNLNGLFAQRRNLFSPTFFRFLQEIGRFNRQASLDLEGGTVHTVTLREYLAHWGYSRFLVDNYLVPMAAAIWSTPAVQIGDFPAVSFLNFFRNHGLLSFRNRPIWKTVVGGSHAYVKAFSGKFRGQLHLRSSVRAIERRPEGVQVTLADGEVLSFDHVVLAAHADQNLAMLKDPSLLETRLLSPWRYQKNHTVLHTDSSLLPRRRSAWAAWNFTRERETEQDRPVFVTYYMNRLQGLRTSRDYCVTLNRRDPFDPATVIAEMDYHHPLYDFDAMATQRELPDLNGKQRTFFCGSYFGYGFHEDAVRSGVAVAKSFGISL